MLSRRTFLQTAGLALAAGSRARAADTLPPVRAITKGPKFHWFGYSMDLIDLQGVTA